MGKPFKSKPSTPLESFAALVLLENQTPPCFSLDADSFISISEWDFLDCRSKEKNALNSVEWQSAVEIEIFEPTLVIYNLFAKNVPPVTFGHRWIYEN